jgi:hypothetical protein
LESESNWRFNVWEQGLWGTDVMLLSRLTAVPNPDAWLARQAGQPQTAFIYLRDPDQVLYNAVTLYNQVGHYPWGWAVEPDV